MLFRHVLCLSVSVQNCLGFSMASFERLKHCEDKQILNGVGFFYKLQVFLKFSS